MVMDVAILLDKLYQFIFGRYSKWLSLVGWMMVLNSARDESHGDQLISDL